MIDQNIDFFQITDNFSKTANIPSIPIFESKLNFVPRVTIAIPTYKRANLLKEALDSAIYQIGFNEYEIIVVDNNPERGCETEQLMKSHNNSRISYYKNSENIGMFGNWNRCIELASGQYLTILNDDDLLKVDYLKVTSQLVKTNSNIDALLVRWHAFSSTEEIEQVNEKKKRNRYFLKKITPLDLLYGNINPGSLGILFRKSVIMKFGGYNEFFYPTSDYALWVHFIKHSSKLYFYNNTLAYYRILVNESLKLNIQLENLNNDKYLRHQLSEMIPKLKLIIELSLPVFEYIQFIKICNFSPEFNLKYSDIGINLKKNISVINRIAFYSVKIIRKLSVKLIRI